MDAQLIYIKSKTLKAKIKWRPVAPGSEWIYFDISDASKKELVITTIRTHLKTKSIYNILGRKDSVRLDLDDFEKNIEEFIQVKSCLIWDSSFEKVIEFHAIGVMRCGAITNNIEQINLSQSFLEGQKLLKNIPESMSDVIIGERRADL